MKVRDSVTQAFFAPPHHTHREGLPPGMQPANQSSTQTQQHETHTRTQAAKLQHQDHATQPAMETAMKAVEKVSEALPNVVTTALPTALPPQSQDEQPGVEAEMTPAPEYIKSEYVGSGKLTGKVALITGGDSGIGRAVAVHFAREGAKAIVIVYKGGAEDTDAKDTVALVEAEGAACLSLVADVGDAQACAKAVDTSVTTYGTLDILVNNAAEQHYRHSILDISNDQLERTFATNIFSMFYLTQAALPHMKDGSSIINSTSVTAYLGESTLLDYATTKGCICTFTRSLSEQLVEKGIRVNAVAPGPIWTPLIPATFPKAAIPAWQSQTPMKRAAQPSEVAPCYVFLASEDASFFSGQVLHPNGGMPVSS